MPPATCEECDRSKELREKDFSHLFDSLKKTAWLWVIFASCVFWYWNKSSKCRWCLDSVNFSYISLGHQVVALQVACFAHRKITAQEFMNSSSHSLDQPLFPASLVPYNLGFGHKHLFIWISGLRAYKAGILPLEPHLQYMAWDLGIKQIQAETPSFL
jgi:hypothetical protein